MSNNILDIMKKEFVRFFGDKKMAFSVIILPGLLIYVIYSALGQVTSSEIKKTENEKSVVEYVNLPKSLQSFKKMKGFEALEVQDDELKDAKKNVKNGDIDAVVVFSKDFDEKVADYDVTTAKKMPENIEIFYNSDKKNSEKTKQILNESLNQYEKTLANKFDVNRENLEKNQEKNSTELKSKYDLSTDDNTFEKDMLATMVPFLIVILLFSGALAVSIESIAGEKERGTLGTILATPIKRTDIAYGKVFSLAIFALLGSISSFIGIVSSLPKLMGSEEMGLNFNKMYGMKDYCYIFIIIAVLTLFSVACISIGSALAKSVKSVQAFSTPLMLLFMAASFAPKLLEDYTDKVWFYAIPLVNITSCLKKIFEGSIQNSYIILTVIVSIICIQIMVVALGKIFNSEKIMFSK